MVLNRTEVIEIVNNLKLPIDKYVITSGSAMVLHNLREMTNDVDITVNSDLFEQFVEKGYEVKYHKINDIKSCTLIDLSDEIQLICIDEIPNKYVTIVDGIPTQTIEHLLEFKLGLNREKDQSDINILKKYLGDVL